MSVRAVIEYCVVWNYQPRAAGLAAELTREFPGASVQLVPSSGGRFEVSVDDRLVFSKAATRRHAEPGEVVRLIRGQKGKDW